MSQPPPDPLTPTPFADGFAMKVCLNWDGAGDQTKEIVPAKIARELEKRLSLASAKLEQMEKALKMARDAFIKYEWTVDTDPTREHRLMMLALDAVLASSLNTEKKT